MKKKENLKSYYDECMLGAVTGYPWELSESDYAMITVNEARKLFREMMGDPKKWLYECDDEDGRTCKAKGDTSILFNNK